MVNVESASTPISKGGYRYNPDDDQDREDFADHTADELCQLQTERDLDFSAHPAQRED